MADLVKAAWASAVEHARSPNLFVDMQGGWELFLRNHHIADNDPRLSMYRDAYQRAWTGAASIANAHDPASAGGDDYRAGVADANAGWLQYRATTGTAVADSSAYAAYLGGRVAAMRAEESAERWRAEDSRRAAERANRANDTWASLCPHLREFLVSFERTGLTVYEPDGEGSGFRCGACEVSTWNLFAALDRSKDA